MIAILLLTVALQLPLEPGATDLDGGLTGQGACLQASVQGVWAIDGSCVTPADYAVLYSNEALVAAGIEPDPEPDPLTRSVAFDPVVEPSYTFEVWLGQVVARFGSAVAL